MATTAGGDGRQKSNGLMGRNGHIDLRRELAGVYPSRSRPYNTGMEGYPAHRVALLADPPTGQLLIHEFPQHPGRIDVCRLPSFCPAGRL